MARLPVPDTPSRFRLTCHWEVDGHISPSIDLIDLIDAWCPVLGPSSTLLWHYLARAAAHSVTDITTATLGSLTGLAPGQAAKNVQRLVTFSRAEWIEPDLLSVILLAKAPRQHRASHHEPDQITRTAP